MCERARLDLSKDARPLVLVRYESRTRREAFGGESALVLGGDDPRSSMRRVVAAASSRSPCVPCQMNTGNKHGATPLHAAACGGSRDAARVLLECGAKLDSHDYLGLAPAEHAEVAIRLAF